MTVAMRGILPPIADRTALDNALSKALRAGPMKLSATVFSAMLVLAACGDDDDGAVTDTLTDTAPGDTGGDAAEETTPDTAPDVTEDTADTADTAPDAAPDTTPAETTGEACVPGGEPPCSDEQIATLQLSKIASGGAITEEGTEPGVFLTHIDATAGGFGGTLGYTYARFTDEGLEAVDLSDEDALDSTEWDIAARRFVLRLNSGVSGPSCVTGGRTGPATEFNALTEVPEGITLHKEQYFTEDKCEYVADTSGIGSPQTVLSSYWTYPGCVAMTGNVYVIELADGRHLKLQVLSYYTPEVQTECDETGTASTPSGSGNFRIQWAFLD